MRLRHATVLVCAAIGLAQAGHAGESVVQTRITPIPQTTPAPQERRLLDPPIVREARQAEASLPLPDRTVLASETVFAPNRAFELDRAIELKKPILVEFAAGAPFVMVATGTGQRACWRPRGPFQPFKDAAGAIYSASCLAGPAGDARFTEIELIPYDLAKARILSAPIEPQALRSAPSQADSDSPLDGMVVRRRLVVIRSDQSSAMVRTEEATLTGGTLSTATEDQWTILRSSEECAVSLAAGATTTCDGFVIRVGTGTPADRAAVSGRFDHVAALNVEGTGIAWQPAAAQAQ